MKIELTKDEAEALLQLLDVAVKAGGLQTARAAVALVDKVVAAAKEPEDPVDSEQADG